MRGRAVRRVFNATHAIGRRRARTTSSACGDIIERLTARPLIRRCCATPPSPAGGRTRAIAACICVALLASPAFAKPQRVVSLNLCADELALRLADPGVVKSVTWLSQDPRNANMAAKAAALPANDGHAEEALAYRSRSRPGRPVRRSGVDRAAESRSARRSSKSARRRRSTACAGRSAISPPRSASRSAARRWSPTWTRGWRASRSIRAGRG